MESYHGTLESQKTIFKIHAVINITFPNYKATVIKTMWYDKDQMKLKGAQK